MKRRFAWVQVLAALLLLTGCVRVRDKRGPFNEARAMRVVATTGMVGDAVREIGGPRVEVTTMMGPGVDPHLYKAGVRDSTLVGDADAIFYSGLHLEGKMTEVFERLGSRRRASAIAEGIPHELLHREEGGQVDPHVWFDVALWSKAAEQARDSLIEFDPKHRDEYDQRAAKYLRELRELHEFAKREMASIPASQRVLITAHDAFGYFGKAYGVEVLGLQGISTASEYGLGDVQSLVRFLTQRRVKAVFVESSVSSRAIEAVVQGCRARGHEVRIGGTLYSDAFGPRGSGADSYIGMVRHNVRTIASALKGTSS
jgi:manganese/zinc/iron transport system substrate-binding protein